MSTEFSLLLDEVELRELRAHLLSVHPGQRVRLNTLLRRPVQSSRVERLLRDREALRAAVGAISSLCAIVCTGCLEGEDESLILRRRFDPEERVRAVIDLNNLLWTVTPEVLQRALLELRRCGVEVLHGIGDANLPFLVSEGVLGMLRETLDTLALAPGGTPADQLILRAAEREKSLILSNDMFREWRRTSSWCRRNIHRLRVPLLHRPHSERGYSFGEAGIELSSPPPA